MKDKLNKNKKKITLKKLKKNWRLIQLMTLLEQTQGCYSLKNNVENSFILNKSFLKNEVRYKNTFITNPLIENKKIIKEQEFFQNFNKKIKNYIRFPINANFVAQWISENIVSSKTYKLSLICDRVIKLANLKTSYAQVNVDLQEKSLLRLVGIKIVISGRILGAEIATSKTFKVGQIPNNTIKILKNKGFALAKTRSGTIGIKVIYFWSALF
jgi:hypothetical protein